MKKTDTLTLTRIPISDLIPDPENPRKDLQPDDAEYQKIDRSMQEFGLADPIQYDTASNIVIAGHQRLKVLKDRGFTHLYSVELGGISWAFSDIDLPKLSEAQRKGLNLALNKITGEWDMQQLSIVLSELKEADFDISIAGFSDKELKEIDAELFGETKTLGGSRIFSDEDIAEAAYRYYQKNGFPYPKVTIFEAMQEINKLAVSGAPRNAFYATVIADTYNPHRFKSAAQGMKSPVEAYRDPSLKKQFLFLLEYSGFNNSYHSAIGTSRGAQGISNFRAGAALYYYRRYAKKGNTILDTCMGYGGRLVGYIASGINGVYIGIDPSTKSCEGNQRLAADLHHEKYVELICSPVEDLTPGDFADRADFALTSPPYFTNEIYADENTQSCHRYPVYEDWLEKFLDKMIAFQYVALKDKAYTCINIDDVSVKGRLYPLVRDTRRLAEERGFTFITAESLDLALSPSLRALERPANESVLIFQK